MAHPRGSCSCSTNETSEHLYFLKRLKQASVLLTRRIDWHPAVRRLVLEYVIPLRHYLLTKIESTWKTEMLSRRSLERVFWWLGKLILYLSLSLNEVRREKRRCERSIWSLRSTLLIGDNVHCVSKNWQNVVSCSFAHNQHGFENHVYAKISLCIHFYLFNFLLKSTCRNDAIYTVSADNWPHYFFCE